VSDRSLVATANKHETAPANVKGNKDRRTDASGGSQLFWAGLGTLTPLRRTVKMERPDFAKDGWRARALCMPTATIGERQAAKRSAQPGQGARAHGGGDR